MLRVLGIILWWAFLVGAALLVESLLEPVPLGLQILAIAALGIAAIPLMFGREIKERLSRKFQPKPPKDKGLILRDQEAVRQNPGNGWRVARLIMQCPTLDEVDTVFSDFNSAENKTSPEEVFAARALKKSRLLNRDHQDDDWWWEFYDEANKVGISEEEAVSILLRLEELFPGDDDKSE